ncbi:MAG: FAD-binding protein [Planctomycetes bacterium]|jgi:succinate dehydrogenase/fumarate reductase flavoprotein subunit|nr:FAD-binding protein [Planctomycetota bacterium]
MSTIAVGNMTLPFYSANTVIVGAGAAAMNCALQLLKFRLQAGEKRPQDRLIVVTGGVKLGASRMSGSDKQTYYKMGTSPRISDTAEDFAKTLTAFGCCHGDNALIEGICSLRGFYNLVDVGVPFPHEPYGAFIGYKTDHDPYERATSAGPKTSKFMSECLQAQAKRLGLRVIDRQMVAKFITSGEGSGKRIVAMLCVDRSQTQKPNMGMSVFAARNWVLAAGGPGEIYRTTVYPRGQYGIHGAALEAGLEACNLTESQYGLASTKFRWNVSGTYMQVIPRIFSTNARGGDEREFLTEYFDDMPTMALNIFLKGYQWPFDAQRITNAQSSLVDMAVHQETVVRGRKVWMDFLRNPVGKVGWEEFNLQRLPNEALEYLQKTGAMQPLPIDRLAHMNKPAIEIYAENRIDLYKEPLEIAVCAQHHNGGFSVDKWWRSSISNTFVIGEMAGTHGVKRPGGSALNAGQVGALRAAEYISNMLFDEIPASPADLGDSVAKSVEQLQKLCAANSTAGTPKQALAEIADRMTRFGAHIRWRSGAEEALSQAKRQYFDINSAGLRVSSPRELPTAILAAQQCLTQVAMLKSIVGMLDRGAGSRGSHCILEESGAEMHPALIDPTDKKPYRFKPENVDLRNTILCTRFNPAAADLFELSDVSPRPIPNRQIAFEPAWTEFREKAIFRD